MPTETIDIRYITKTIIRHWRQTSVKSAKFRVPRNILISSCGLRWGRRVYI
jgi:hypothetical protein